MSDATRYLQPANADEAVCFDSVATLAAGLDAGAFTSRELTTVFLRRIERLNGDLNAYVTVLPDQALQAADESDQRRRAETVRGPLDGIPVSVKDVEPMKDVRYTAGLLPLADNIGKVDALHVSRLKNAGAVILGKTNTPELGHKAVTDNMLVGPTRNPYRTTANSGGSSGGAAVSVAAGLAAVAQGSDGGGSIRIPASLTGVVGFKGSAFAIPDVIRPDGFAALAPFTHIGPLARTIADANALTSLFARPDRRDPLSGHLPPRSSDRAVSEMRIAYDPHFGNFPVDREVGAVVEAAVRAISAHVVVEAVTVKNVDHQQVTELTRRLISTLFAYNAEQFGDLLGEHRAEIPDELARLIEGGVGLSAVEFRAANAERTKVFDAIEDVFDTADIIATPTLAVAEVPNAPAFGQTLGPNTVDGQAIDPWLGWCLTHPLNLSGHPAVNIPAGYTRTGLPVGLQFIGRRWSDWDLLDFAALATDILAARHKRSLSSRIRTISWTSRHRVATVEA